MWARDGGRYSLGAPRDRIGGALRHPLVADPDERAARLERRALTYLDAMQTPG